MSDNVKVFQLGGVRGYVLTDIYDPDKPVSGTYIPEEGSLVTDVDKSVVYIVDKVDERKKSHLVTQEFGVSNQDRVELGMSPNNKYILYYDPSVKPCRLLVDSNLFVMGSDIYEYRLVEPLPDGTERVISSYIDATGKVIGSRIPVRTYAHNADAKGCTDCHTFFPLKEGQRIVAQFFNKEGMEKYTVDLYTRKATQLNDLSDSLYPITSIEAHCKQEIDDDWYIYPNQTLGELGIEVTLVYGDNDNRKMNVTIDNMRCFLYGDEDYINSYPGKEDELLIKYCLSSREAAVDEKRENGQRYLSLTKKLVVMEDTSAYSVKASVVPLFDVAKNTWKLKYFAYTNMQDRVVDITPYVELHDIPGKAPFDPTVINVYQHVRFSFDIGKVFQIQSSSTHYQDVWIKLAPPSMYTKYMLKDSETNPHVFGVEGTDRRRPVLHYDEDNQSYFIPTSIFGNTNAVLESFYTFANPPYDRAIDVEAPTPTHFTLRNPANGHTLLSAPIAMEDYYHEFFPITQGDKDQYVGGTLIFEFLYHEGEVFHILYGVPVDVYKTKTSYNDENNIMYPNV